MTDHRAASQVAAGEVRARILFRPIIAGTLSHEPWLNEIVEFLYDAADPYAVRLLIPDGAYIQEWLIDRGLLSSGRRTHAGEGSLRVYPAAFDGTPVVVLAFLADGEFQEFGISRRALGRFLRRTYDLVPAGAEAPAARVDQALEHLLSGVA